MPLIDDRGRLFGKVNLIDAAVAGFVLVLIPVGYGALLLFRTPVPVITTIEPQQVTEKDKASLTVAGKDFRPFLHAKFGTVESAGFLVQSPTLAEIKVPTDLPAGTYDVVLYDEGQELVRKTGAVHVVPPVPPPPIPRMPVQVLGEFVGLAEEGARFVRVGATFRRQPPEPATPAAGPDQLSEPPLAEVLAVRPATAGVQRIRAGSTTLTTPLANTVQVPAVIRVNCVMTPDQQCKVDDVVLARDATIVLPVAAQRQGQSGEASPDHVRFLVQEVRSADAPAVFPSVKRSIATLRLRFVTLPEVVDLIRVGALDIGGPPAASGADKASLIAVGSERQSLTGLGNVETSAGRSVQASMPMVSFTGTVRVPVVLAQSGWQYKDKPVKVGSPFVFETTAGFMEASILEMSLGSVAEVPVP